MSVNGGAKPSAGHDWPGADEHKLATACVGIARHIVRGPARSIGLLPVGKARSRHAVMDLSPLLERLAAALSSFTGGPNAFIGPWPTWGSQGPGSSSREVRHHVLQVLPGACASAQAAEALLPRALASIPGAVGHVLVDLGGYAPVLRVPSVVGAVDGVLLVVQPRRAEEIQVARMMEQISAQRRLGAIVVG